MGQPQLKFNSTEEMKAYFKKEAESQHERTQKALKGQVNSEEKPLSAMKKSELRAYADKLGLKYDEDFTNAELRELIQEELDEIE